MKKTLTKILSVMLIVCITLTSAPLSGLVGLELPEWLDLSIISKAAETSGSCGENLTWSYDTSSYTLTISGTGSMYSDYYNYNNRPWESYEDNIKNVVINNGVTTISYYAFYDCSTLTSVTIPDSVSTIGSSAFSNCNNLTDVYYGGLEAQWNKISIEGFNNPLLDATIHYKKILSGICGDNVTWTYDSSTYILTISGTGDMYDYESNNRPWEKYGDSIENVVINNGVTAIGDWTFFSCDNLTSVIIPISVMSIGDCAFHSCSSLPGLTIPDSVTVIGSHTFYSCNSLSNITIPDSVTIIGEAAFGECHSLASVTIGDGVTTIGKSAFGHCTRLASVTIGGSVTTIGDSAFYYCRKLTNITMPDSVITIGNYAFDSCDGLTSVIIPGSVTTIGDYAFYNCFSLTSVTIPDSVTIIGDSAFEKCNSLTSITIPDSVTTIGNDVFASCDSLTSVIIGNGITVIGDYAFYHCDGLTSIIIPDSVTTIGNSAFYYCTNLISVTIGDGVTTIGDSAFLACDSLIIVYYGGTEAQWNEISIGSGNLNLYFITIYFEECKHDYKPVLTPPTCTKRGYTTYTCECGDSYVADYVDVISCNYKTTVTSPTCTEKGYTTNVCATCGNSYIDNYKGATGHDYDDGIVTTKPTCTKAGFKTFTCVNCGDTYTEEVSELSHTPANVVEENCIAPTCTETGSKEYVTYCTACNAEISRKEIIIDALGHEYEPVVTVPTCTTQGFTTYTSHCGDTYTGDYVDASGHNYKDGICTDCDTSDPSYFTFEIQKPSTTTIRCKDGIKLHAKTTGNLPDGARIEWSKNNSNFDVNTSTSGNEITIISKNNGYTTFTATVYDADNNVIAQDTIEMYSKAGFFDKIGGFFRSLFGSTKIYDN